MNQTHDKLKVFEGKTFEEAASLAEEFSKPGNIEAKSIGLIYRPTGVIICLGYVDNAENGYKIEINRRALGPESIDINDLQKVMSEALTSQGPILCHDIFEYEDGSLGIVFLREG